MSHRLIILAEEYAKHYHKGQFRKGSNQPYHTHTFAVRDILVKYGYDDEITQCIAILHDTIEDTELVMGELKEIFGYEIANGVYILSKNTLSKTTTNFLNNLLPEGKEISHDNQYKLRLSCAREKIIKIKIADTIHNTEDLINLSPKGIKKKLYDAKTFYIPLGKIISPLMVKELIKNINDFNKAQEKRKKRVKEKL